MSDSAPRVSIGMPVYNGAMYVRAALDSILSQTFTDFELVISDNASQDETESICREYAARDRRVRYLRCEQNTGAIVNFNRLVALTRGEYFKWAAADDLCAPTFLEELVEVLDHDPEVAWCHVQTAKINAEGRLLELEEPIAEGLAHTSQAGMPRADHDSPWPHRRFAGVLLGTTWCADCYGLIRRSALDATHLYPACYGAEKVLLGELALIGKYHEVPRTLFFQRVHARAAGSLQNSQAQAEYMLARGPRRFSSTRLTLLAAHYRAVRRARLSRTQRWRCYAVLVQYLCQFHKWWWILQAELRGAAVRARPRRARSTLESNAANIAVLPASPPTQEQN